MKTNIIIIVSTIIIAFAIIFSGLSISSAISLNNEVSLSNSLLMNEADAAKYIGIKETTLKNIIIMNNKEKYNLSTYPTYKFVPYIVIDGNKYFSKAELDKWVEFSMYNK